MEREALREYLKGAMPPFSAFAVNSAFSWFHIAHALSCLESWRMYFGHLMILYTLKVWPFPNVLHTFATCFIPFH